MQDEPAHWKGYYSQLHSKAVLDMYYSLSDRLRYYWPHPAINDAVNIMLVNLSNVNIPLGMISQYFPEQFQRVLANKSLLQPKNLIINRIQDVLSLYAAGCDQ